MKGNKTIASDLQVNLDECMNHAECPTVQPSFLAACIPRRHHQDACDWKCDFWSWLFRTSTQCVMRKERERGAGEQQVKVHVQTRSMSQLKCYSHSVLPTPWPQMNCATSCRYYLTDCTHTACRLVQSVNQQTDGWLLIWKTRLHVLLWEYIFFFSYFTCVLSH